MPTGAGGEYGAARPLLPLLVACLFGGGLLHGAAARGTGDGTETVASAQPEIVTGSRFVVKENETSVATLTATDDDTDVAELTWGLVSGGDASHFTLGAGTGVLAFAAAKDYEAPDDVDGDGTYELTVEVSDGVETDRAEFEVVLENVLELASAITGPASVSFPENSAFRVASYAASSEQDSADVAWSLSGVDSGHFNVDDPGGVLRFRAAPVAPDLFPRPPDYEAPADGDGLNDYEVVVQASDGVTTRTLEVTVSVTDVNESGTLTLSASRPRTGEALTATLVDPDGVVGTTTWQWARSTGPDAWEVVAGATSAAHTPTAADAGRFLRVTATYEDGLGEDGTAVAMTSEVVAGPLLSGLTAATTDSSRNSSRRMKPAFDSGTLHYAIGCRAGGDTMTLTPSVAAGARLAVDGVQASSGEAVSVRVNRGGGDESDVRITLSDGADGATTTYVVHCASSFVAEARTEPGVTGVIEDLMAFRRHQTLAIIDSNGVPRFHRVLPVLGASTYFRGHETDEGFRYSYTVPRTTSSVKWVVLDEGLEEIHDGVTTVSPLTNTDLHDFRILENGDYLQVAYQRARRDLSGLTFDGPNGEPWGSSVQLRDSAIQIVTPEERAAFTWNSWNAMALEDCTQGSFPDDYSHINTVQMVGGRDGYIAATFRGCSTVLGVDPDLADAHKIVWRVGRSNLTAEEWAARDLGPPPLTIVNDPEGEFCGPHAGQVLPNGNLFLYDNGVVCVRDPVTNRSKRRSGEYSRAVEYALDLANNEAVFLRDHSLHGSKRFVGSTQGHVEVLNNGDWLISWGSGRSNSDASKRPDEAATQVDPNTGTEKFSLLATAAVGQYAIRVTTLPAVALASSVEALEGRIVEIADFHVGTTDRPTVVVAFNQPIVDVGSAASSVAVTGVSSWSVAPHLESGAPANAYAFTLTPAGDGPVVFELVGDAACTDGPASGICTAAGTRLAGDPVSGSIPGPLTVSLGSAVHSVTEGESVEVMVTLDRAHGRSGDLEIPLDVRFDGASAADLTAGSRVVLGPTETAKGFAVAALADNLVEGAEAVVVGFGAVLPGGVAARNVIQTTLTITDATDDEIRLAVGETEVAEGNSTELTFGAGPGITFTTDQTITFTLGGDAGTGDYALSSGGVALTPPYSLTLPAGGNKVSATLLAVDDASREADEQVVISAMHGSASIDSRTVTIPANDRDLPVIVVRSAPAGAAVEGAELAFTLERTGTAAAELTVGVAVSETGDVLVANPPAEVTFEAGSSTATLAVRTMDDRVVEEGSEVTLTVRSSTLDVYDVGSPQSTSALVADNDRATLELTLAPERVVEGRAAEVRIASRDGVRFSTPQRISLEFGGEPADYVVTAGGEALAAPYELTLPALATSVTAMVTAADDSEEEGEERISVAATYGTEVVGAGVLTIAASDSPARVAVAADSAWVDEGDDVAFRLTRTRVTEPDDLAPLAVAVAVGDETGRLADPPPTIVTFEQDEREAVLRLATNEDDLIQVGGDEKPLAGTSVTLTLAADETSVPTAYTLVEGADAASVTVAENDRAEFELAVFPTRVLEGGAVAVSVSVANGVTFSQSLTITIFAGASGTAERGTATPGVDYTATAPGGTERDHLRLRRGRSVATGTLLIADDAHAEGSETIRIAAARDGRGFGAPVVVKVAANDAHYQTRLPPELDLITVNGDELTLLYNEPLDENSAPAPGDFAVLVEAASREVASVVVDGAEVRVGLASPAAHGERVALSYTPASGPIQDLDGNEAPALSDAVAVEVVVSAAPDATAEGEPLDFRVVLSRAVPSDLSVSWTLGGGTAVAGADYEAADNGTLTVAAGVRESALEVRTTEDTRGERDETLVFKLAEPPGFPHWAAVHIADAVGTILDNDGGAPPGSGGGGGGGGAGGSPPDEDDDGLPPPPAPPPEPPPPPPPEPPPPPTGRDPAGSCEPDGETLCLQDSRFAVAVEWRKADGERGAGSVAHAGTNDSGLFTFFDRDNWEILVKVLDGCAVNGRFWVYGASTTDLGYAIRVTDTVTGAVEEYRNEPGTPASAITDSMAFPEGCAAFPATGASSSNPPPRHRDVSGESP